jgi:predicted HicB family RNase H-like nuclease
VSQSAEEFADQIATMQKRIAKVTKDEVEAFFVLNPDIAEQFKNRPRSKAATVELRVRVKEPLRASIEAAAKRNGRSMNAEIVRRLEIVNVILAALETEVDLE